MPETTIPRTLSGGYSPGRFRQTIERPVPREQVPERRHPDAAGVIDLHPAFGRVVVAVVEDPVRAGPQPVIMRRPGRCRDRRDDRAERTGSGAGEKRVEVRHQPALRIGSSTVQVAPSRPRTSSRSTVFGMESFLISRARVLPGSPGVGLIKPPRRESALLAPGAVTPSHRGRW